MQSQNHSIVETGEPSITVPTHTEPHLLPQYYSSGATEFILAIAVFIRSVALLIQVIGQQKEHKSDTKAGSR